MIKRTVISTQTQVCRNCLGDGSLADMSGNSLQPVKCDICNGSGMVSVRKVIHISVAPKVPFVQHSKQANEQPELVLTHN